MPRIPTAWGRDQDFRRPTRSPEVADRRQRCFPPGLTAMYVRGRALSLPARKCQGCRSPARTSSWICHRRAWLPLRRTGSVTTWDTHPARTHLQRPRASVDAGPAVAAPAPLGGMLRLARRTSRRRFRRRPARRGGRHRSIEFRLGRRGRAGRDDRPAAGPRCLRGPGWPLPAACACPTLRGGPPTRTAHGCRRGPRRLGHRRLPPPHQRAAGTPRAHCRPCRTGSRREPVPAITGLMSVTQEPSPARSTRPRARSSPTSRSPRPPDPPRRPQRRRRPVPPRAGRARAPSRAAGAARLRPAAAGRPPGRPDPADPRRRGRGVLADNRADPGRLGGGRRTP
jgi:hypothetical protein